MYTAKVGALAPHLRRLVYTYISYISMGCSFPQTSWWAPQRRVDARRSRKKRKVVDRSAPDIAIDAHIPYSTRPYRTEARATVRARYVYIHVYIPYQPYPRATDRPYCARTPMYRRTDTRTSICMYTYSISVYVYIYVSRICLYEIYMIYIYMYIHILDAKVGAKAPTLAIYNYIFIIQSIK